MERWKLEGSTYVRTVGGIRCAVWETSRNNWRVVCERSGNFGLREYNARGFKSEDSAKRHSLDVARALARVL